MDNYQSKGYLIDFILVFLGLVILVLEFINISNWPTLIAYNMGLILMFKEERKYLDKVNRYNTAI